MLKIWTAEVKEVKGPAPLLIVLNESIFASSSFISLWVQIGVAKSQELRFAHGPPDIRF
jgi:hypothetical protein